MRLFPAVVICCLCAACSSRGGKAAAELRDPAGKVVGHATFAERPDGVRIEVAVKGLPPGKHGMHIHEQGNCDGPLFDSAGAHFNPSQRSHDHDHPAGHHDGDLPNLVVDGSGSGALQIVVSGITLRGQGHHSLFHRGGTSLVIHETEDDLRSITGGRRIVCGVISEP